MLRQCIIRKLKKKVDLILTMLRKELIYALIVGACIQSSHAAIRSQLTYRSNDVTVGKPYTPQFGLSASQAALLPPISPDVLEDTRLPTVFPCLYNLKIVLNFNRIYFKSKRINNFKLKRIIYQIVSVFE